ncbi:MAG: flippase-like domain-containing protein [Bacteroidia bacterium]|nr:flippase-like domain-containing protein [Bacteroidia bacterium]
MFSALPYKTRQFFYFVIKISIVAGAVFYIYSKLTGNQNLKFDDFLQFLIKKDLFSIENIVFLSILTIFNWFFEILKWRDLVKIISPIKFKQALKQSLAALTASLITPNRIGDYAAKVAYYPKSLRKKILLLNLLSHMAQMSATLLFGLTGVYFFYEQYGLDLPLFRIAKFAFIVIVIFSFTIFGLKNSGIRIKGFSWDSLVRFIRSIPYHTRIKTIGYSLVRYGIFSFQFYFLLRLFGNAMPYDRAMMFISTMYLISSIIPTFVLTDVLVKGSVALFLFEITTVDNISILSIITIMWLLNFVFPSILGSFFILNYNGIHSYKSN